MKLTALALAASLAAFFAVPGHAADNPFASQGQSFKMAAADKTVPDAKPTKPTKPKCGGTADGPKCGGTTAGPKCGGLSAESKCGGTADGRRCGGIKPAKNADKAPAK